MNPTPRTGSRQALRTSAPLDFASGSGGVEDIHVLNQGCKTRGMERSSGKTSKGVQTGHRNIERDADTTIGVQTNEGE